MTVQSNDPVIVRHGPFLCEATVEALTERGVIIRYTGQTEFVGFDQVKQAPDGTRLTDRPDQGFIGSAHLPALQPEGWPRS